MSHRIDGLERLLLTSMHRYKVSHRIDGLENTDKGNALEEMVSHRIDGLEMRMVQTLRG